MEHVFKLFEFNVYNDKDLDRESDEDEDVRSRKDNSRFIIQMFGINEEGKKASIIVEEYKPFFYLKVDNNWGETKKGLLYDHLKSKVGKYYEDGILECKLIERKKLYGLSFLVGASERFARRRNLLVVAFVGLSATVFLAAGAAPVPLLVFAGAFNGLILPIGLAVLLWVAARRPDLMGGYVYPRPLAALGLVAWLVTIYLGSESLGRLAALFD